MTTRRKKKHAGGRPPAIYQQPRDVRLEVRMTDDERALAQEQADAHRVHLAEWVRRRVVHAGAEPAS